MFLFKFLDNCIQFHDRALIQPWLLQARDVQQNAKYLQGQKKFNLCKLNLWKQTKEKLKFNIIEGCKKVLEA